jgi:hypothetical protein
MFTSLRLWKAMEKEKAGQSYVTPPPHAIGKLLARLLLQAVTSPETEQEPPFQQRSTAHPWLTALSTQQRMLRTCRGHISRSVVGPKPMATMHSLFTSSLKTRPAQA